MPGIAELLFQEVKVSCLHPYILFILVHVTDVSEVAVAAKYRN